MDEKIVEFKKTILKCLLSGEVSPDNKKRIENFVRSEAKSTIICRDATDDEEFELYEKQQNKDWQEQLKASSMGNNPEGAIFDKAIYLQALKSNYNDVRQWFENAFGLCTTIDIVVFYGWERLKEQGARDEARK